MLVCLHWRRSVKSVTALAANKLGKFLAKDFRRVFGPAHHGMVGREILQGMTLSQRIEPTDYLHLIVSCLLHDIGYMRGILSGDTETEFVVDASGTKITLPRGASDAALSPYHVDRSKLFAAERLAKSPNFDVSRIAAAIEMTRFPATSAPSAN